MSLTAFPSTFLRHLFHRWESLLRPRSQSSYNTLVNCSSKLIQCFMAVKQKLKRGLFLPLLQKNGKKRSYIWSQMTYICHFLDNVLSWYHSHCSFLHFISGLLLIVYYMIIWSDSLWRFLSYNVALCYFCFQPVIGCEKSPLKGYPSSTQQPLCYVTSQADGSFLFLTVPSGQYYLVSTHSVIEKHW